MEEIKNKLHDKHIFLMPYCHADHAWLHSRDWHLRRYLVVFDRAIELLRSNSEFKYFFDGWSELLAPCLEKRPESIPFLNEMLKKERLAIVGGHWSNIRFSHVGNETSIRNMIFGRKQISNFFPEATLDSYANLDVGVGHSQVPQLLRMGGYENYFAWRPQRGLDSQGVPRRFFWKGLDGSEALVSRHSYQGWFHSPEFVDFHGKKEIFDSQEVEFDHVVTNAWEKHLKVPAEQSGISTLSFCQGSDDCLPLIDAFYGFEREIDDILQRWNASGDFGRIDYGTPRDVFKALKTEKNDIPVWNGTLDQTEVCFNIARNGKNSIWFLRESADRALILAEQISATAAAVTTFHYPEKKLEELWTRHLTFCTHALEFLFKKDFDNARFSLESVVREAQKIQKQAMRTMVSSSEVNDPSHFSIYNPIPERYSTIVELEIPNIDNSRRSPVLKNSNGGIVPSQINYIGGLAADFSVLVETELQPGRSIELGLEWSDKEAVSNELVEIKNMDFEMNFDRMKITLKKGVITKIENPTTGTTVSAIGEAGILEPVALPQKMGYWMAESFADNPLPFIPTSLSIAENGPLRFRIVRTGTSGPHSFTQKIDLLKGSDSINIETIADIAPDSANIALGMPLPNNATLNVDIPFGVEKRDLASIEYGHEGEGNYENIERRIPGIFWGRSWCFAKDESRSFGLISIDGPKYFRRYGKPERLLHLLACVHPDRQNGWMSKTYSQRALGRHEFSHSLVLAGNDWKTAEMVAASQKTHVKTVVTLGKTPLIENKELSISPSEVRLSAFYKKDGDFILRVYNASSKNRSCDIVLPFKVRYVEFCDFNGVSQNRPIASKDNVLAFELRPWEIATLKIAVGCCSDELSKPDHLPPGVSSA